MISQGGKGAGNQLLSACRPSEPGPFLRIEPTSCERMKPRPSRNSTIASSFGTTIASANTGSRPSSRPAA